MFTDDIKKQAKDLVTFQELTPEMIEEFNANAEPILKFETLDTPDDAKALWDKAWNNEIKQNTLEENEKKYDAVIVRVTTNELGEKEKEVIVAYSYVDQNDDLYVKHTALGYDRLPPDVQKAWGNREDVVGKWVKADKELEELDNTFIQYFRGDAKGFDSWEEYRDYKLGSDNLGARIQNAQDVDENAPPRETPSIDKEDKSINL